MKKRELLIKGVPYVRVGKPVALKLLDKGLELVVIPCNYHPDAMHCFAYYTDKTYLEQSGYSMGEYFDNIVMFNCSPTSGRYLSFYVKKSDLEVLKND